MAGGQFVHGAMRVVTASAARVGSADRQFVLGAEVVVTSLTRSVRYVVPIVENGTGNPSPTVMIDDVPLYRQNS